MKALLVEHDEGNHPQTAQEVIKTEVDNILAKG